MIKVRHKFYLRKAAMFLGNQQEFKMQTWSKSYLDNIKRQQERARRGGRMGELAMSIITHFYLLGKGGYVFGSVGLSVCLFVRLWTTLLKKL